MSSSGEKTEQPTRKKLDDARKKGQVPQSQDVHKLLVTGVGFELVIATKDYMLVNINDMFVSNINALNTPFNDVLGGLIKETIFTGLKCSLLILLAVIVARLVSGWMQFGLLMAPETLIPSLDKLNPINAIKQIFSVKKIVELLLNIAKCIVIFAIFYVITFDSLGDILLSATGNIQMAVEAGSDIFIFAARVSITLLLVISILDFLLQKKFFIKQHMMTKDEVFREYKQQEGDPQTKAQRKALGREIVESAPASIKSVDEANAVVVNPTHFAVALRYIPGEDPLPKILCKGVDERASEIIKRAYNNNTPVIRYIWLARTLYSTGKEGRLIPKQTLKPAAAVYKSVFELLDAGSKFDSRKTLELDEFKNPPR